MSATDLTFVNVTVVTAEEAAEGAVAKLMVATPGGKIRDVLLNSKQALQVIERLAQQVRRETR